MTPFPQTHLAIAALTTALFLSGASASADMMEVVDIADGDTLNLRTGPAASFPDVGDLSEHMHVDVLAYNEDGKWAQILRQGRIYWVAARYLTAPNSRDESGTAMSSPTVGPNVVMGIAVDDVDGGLVVRSGAGTSFGRLGVLPNHTAVHVIQFDRHSDWAMIDFGSDVGWVSTAYLAAMASSPQPMPDASPGIAPDGGTLPAVFSVTGVSSGDVLWVRDAPQPNGAQLGSLNPGAVVNVNGRSSGNWGQITLNGQIGYVNMSFLTRKADTAHATTANGFPLGLTCRGTEPFWTLTIGEDRSFQYTSLIDGQDPIRHLAIATPALTGGYPYRFKAQSLTGMIDQQACSDGMSDVSYTMTIQLRRPSGSGVNVENLFGCCDR
ncbi:SH3 domain-containing protein [Shimia sagamensis]|uniref:Uncharacterized conserved protein YgiM, contains N-terminal SH3 domain, DUF1202 family n=1 Tax=Shimia sagamensis TaxID=1566352 RepID=A0ABY1NMT9_9RHOB|nr:SH3 domain-containing protein [Shimia sagamensis]SMP13812.1 Uncharacterized conserved protein YgiM, contains N-terminal SH3 domain, DUF1202 family [Shimia sagamensis]